jgi:protein-disulfide isomerase
MTSGKQARRQRQQVGRPPVRSTEGRRASPRMLLAASSGLVLLAAAIVLVVVLGGGSGSSGASGTTLPDANAVLREFEGIPQQGFVLGKATAPVTLREYIDLQCPACRAFETAVMPAIIRRYVRPGKVKVEARVIAFIGPDSERGRKAAIAAARQNRLFDFTQLLYFNQGAENSGWLDDQMVADAAASIPGVDVKTLQEQADSSATTAQAVRFDDESRVDGVQGTPTLLAGKTGQKLTSLGSGVPSVQQLSTVLDRALK